MSQVSDTTVRRSGGLPRVVIGEVMACARHCSSFRRDAVRHVWPVRSTGKKAKTKKKKERKRKMYLEKKLTFNIWRM